MSKTAALSIFFKNIERGKIDIVARSTRILASSSRFLVITAPPAKPVTFFSKPKLKTPASPMVPAGEPIGYAAFVTAVFDHFGRARGKPLVGDKTPAYARSVDVLHANGATVTTPVSIPSTTTPGGTLEGIFNQIVGTGNATDLVADFSFYIPEFNAAGNPVLSPGTGTNQQVVNNVTASGTFTPLPGSGNTTGTVTGSGPSSPSSEAPLSAAGSGMPQPPGRTPLRGPAARTRLPPCRFARLRRDHARCCPARLRHDVPQGRP